MALLRAQWLSNPCRLGGPQCFQRGTKSKLAHMWAQWLPNPCRLGGPQFFARGTKSEIPHMWAQWLPKPCRLGGLQCFALGQNHKWPTCGHSGYLTHAVSGVPKARGGGGILGNRISCLKTPPEPNLKKGGGLGGFKGDFRCAGVLSAETPPPPRPPKPPPPPPPNEEHSVGHLRTVGYAAQV